MSFPGLSGVNGHYNESFVAFIKRLIFRGKHAAHEVAFIILSFINICISGIGFGYEAFLYQKGISFYCDTLDFLLRQFLKLSTGSLDAVYEIVFCIRR